MATEKQIEVFNGIRNLWIIPVGIISIFVILMFIKFKAGFDLSFLLVILIAATVRELGPLFRNSAQRVVVTSHRIKGEISYGIFSGRPSIKFSVPYSEVVGIDSFLFGKGLMIRVAGYSKPIKILGIENSFVLMNFLQNIQNIIKNRVKIEDGIEFDPVFSPKPWPNKYNPLKLCIHETTDMVARNIPDASEPFEPLDLSPSDATIDFRGGWLRWTVVGLASLIFLGAVFFIGAYVIAVSDSQKRLGGSTLCVTVARAYRQALPNSVNILLDRLDNDPSRKINRFVASRIVGSLMLNAYQDDVFAKSSDIQCGLKLAAEYYDEGTIATEIADEIQGEVLALLK